jgi:hypothetical protein
MTVLRSLSELHEHLRNSEAPITRDDARGQEAATTGKEQARQKGASESDVAELERMVADLKSGYRPTTDVVAPEYTPSPDAIFVTLF